MAACPQRGERIYRLGDLHLSGLAPGALRVADDGDLDLVDQWTDQFPAEGMPVMS